MRKQILAALGMLLVAGGFSLVGANGTYNIPGKWYGFITDTADLRKGSDITGDAIRKSVAEKGAQYALINGFFFQSHIALAPADKVAPFAGQTAFVEGAITTNSLTKGAAYVEDTQEAAGSANDAAPVRAFTIKVTTITPHPAGPSDYYLGVTAGVGSTSSR